MKEMIEKVEKLYNALSIRERMLICAGVVLFFYGVWYTILYDYVLATDTEIAKKAGDIKDQISLLEGQIDSMSEVIGRNPTSLLIDQSKQLKRESDFLSQKITEQMKKMMSAKEMANVLRNVIEKTDGLTLIDMESQETKPLFDAKTIKDGDQVINVQAFVHGLKIEMIGGYFETLKFLRAVEKQNTNIVWDELTYQVMKYPKAKIVIYLHAIGVDEGWVDV